MRSKDSFALAATVVCLVACANRTPPVSASLAPEQIVKALNGGRLGAWAESDSVFGLAMIRRYLQPTLERCRTDNGKIEVLSQVPVVFAARSDDPSGRNRIQLLMPAKFGCRVNSAVAWGADIGYASSTYYPPGAGNGIAYYTTIQLNFVAGTQFELAEARSTAVRQEALNASKECTTLRQVYTQRIQASPQIGMRVAYGVIVDLRPPLALIQYDELGQQMKARVQEWVQISTLSAGSDCPR